MAAKSTGTKKNSSTGKATATRKVDTSGMAKGEAVAAEKLEELEKAAASKAKLIRPQYEKFVTPTGEWVIIQKIGVGPRDEITASAAIEGSDTLDNGKFAHHVVNESMVYPEISFDDINQMDPDDFTEIFDHAFNLSYRQVGKLVQTFPAGTDD